MKIENFKNGFELLLSQAASMLGGPARAVQLQWDVEQSLKRRMIRRERTGIGTEQPIVYIEQGRRGHEVAIGIQAYGLQADGQELPIAEVNTTSDMEIPCFWAVRVQDYRRFYRLVRQHLKAVRENHVQPIMSPTDFTRLWNSTIGFLRRDLSALKKYGVPQKRGVLLSGDPGNGKTMACRWLSAQCERMGLAWETVTVDDYQAAQRDCLVRELFVPDRTGIVLFDDFDAPLRDRRSSENPTEQSTFLAEMDGMNPKAGVVYLFTSNLRADELDPALRRPGRIDEIIRFEKPDAELRERFVRERWHPDIVQRLAIADLVAETDGFSFAELDEVKKQLVLRYFDTGRLDWQVARAALDDRKNQVAKSRPIGFTTAPMLFETPAATSATADGEADC